MISPAEFYSGKREKYSTLLEKTSSKLKRFAWYRFFAFILILLPAFIFGLQWVTITIGTISLVLFLFLIKKNIQLENIKNKYLVLKKLSEDEILALNYEFTHFEAGDEFLDTSHSFSYDLDLFGKGSLFQFINRTSTQSGRQKLADWLKNPPIQNDVILKKQEAVDELAKIPNWRLYFLANGHLFRETKQLNDEVKAWSDAELKMKDRKLITWLINVVPVFTVLSVIPVLIGLSNLPLIFLVITQWTLLSVYWKRIGYYYNFFGRKSRLFSKYVQLLRFIEDREFQSDLLIELQRKIKKPILASKVFFQLKNCIKEFEYRENILIGIILNSIFLWDIRNMYRLWKWHQKHHKELATWLDVIAEFDALISLANLAYNQPGYIFPEVHEGGFTFNAKNLGHPLLHPKKCIANDLSVDGWSKVLIITGANMAGKSTFLRTVGVNLVLAGMGGPVCAQKMVFTPVEIYTNMRTTDSLLKDESYFFAELKRIKGVLERLEQGERIFVILDEMLKGTNSVDKLNGSKELLRKLLKLKSVSLIATHDLKLSEMEDEFPQQVFNKCFETRIENDDMVYDYKLADGVTKTMNATFLMKKMGII